MNDNIISTFIHPFRLCNLLTPSELSDKNVHIYEVNNDLLLSIDKYINTFYLIRLCNKDGEIIKIPSNFKIYNISKDKYIDPLKDIDTYVLTILFNYTVYHNDKPILKLQNVKNCNVIRYENTNR